MDTQATVQAMLTKSLEGMTGISIDQSTVVIALIGFLVIYIGFRIVVDAIGSGLESRGSSADFEGDSKEAAWYLEGSKNNDSQFGRDVNRAKYNNLVRRNGRR